MASLHSVKAIRSSFFHLPPHLRTAAFTHATTTTRPFSSTPRRNVDPVSILTAGPNFLMDSLHHLGLSWAAVIPCTAVLLRGVVTYYLITLPQRRKDRQAAAVQPLIHAYTLMHREQPHEKEREMKAFKDGGEAGLKFYKAGWLFRSSIRGWWELGYLTGVSRWQTVGSKLANFGILMAVLEAIRMKCGRGEGLLSLVLAPLTAAWHAVRDGVVWLTKAHESAAAQASAQAAVENAPLVAVESLREADVGEPTPEVSPAINADPSLSEAPLFPTLDPTLQTEGLPFCPDLTLADPTGILPVGLFLAMATQAFLSPRPPKSFVPKKTWLGAFDEKWRTLPFGQKLSVFVAGYFWIVAQSLPAGMVLYLITSMSMGFVQRVWLDVRYPALKAITPCVRPVRQKRKRLW